jgi:hypothetical protein
MRSPILILSVLLLRFVPASACDGPAEDEVKVSVVAILASETRTLIDPRLEDIAKELRKKYPKMTGFRLAKMSCKSIPRDQAESFELVADQKALITVMKTADKQNNVQLKLTPPTAGEITYTVKCGKFFPVVTTYKTDSLDPEALIIAVRVQPCKK